MRRLAWTLMKRSLEVLMPKDSVFRIRRASRNATGNLRAVSRLCAIAPKEDGQHVAMLGAVADEMDDLEARSLALVKVAAALTAEIDGSELSGQMRSILGWARVAVRRGVSSKGAKH